MAKILSACGQVRPSGGGGSCVDGQLVEPWRGAAGDALDAELAGDDIGGITGLCV